MSIQAILNNKGAEVIAIESEKTVEQALQMMNEKAIGALVVTGDGEICHGIFTERCDARLGPTWRGGFARICLRTYDRTPAEHCAEFRH
jgi:CBS-domain-containing membrane protein